MPPNNLQDVSSLVSLDEAKQKVLVALTPRADTQNLTIAKALNSVLAEDIYSPIDVPSYDNSAMDGFALNSSALGENCKLNISQTILAGDVAETLLDKTAARIFTGAMVPVNADTVIAQENCRYDSRSEGANSVELPKSIQKGMNIRLRGQDVSKNQKVFDSGRRLSAQDIGLLASLGVATVPCFKPLKVALVSTGNELLEPHEDLQAGKIFNSNRYMLEAFLCELNVDICISKIIKDDLEETKQSFKSIANECDCIISTGGVSVGDSDFVKDALSSLGKLDLWRLALKPGKPFSFGSIQEKPFFGLPGNPVAVFVTFLLLVKPALQKLQGESSQETSISFQVKVDFELKANSKRLELLRVKLVQKEGENYLELYPNQSSGVLSSTCYTDGLAVLGIGESLRKGDFLEFIPYSCL